MQRLQAPGEHLLIARLENVQRKEGVGEELRTRQHHDGRVIRQVQGLVADTFQGDLRERFRARP